MVFERALGRVGSIAHFLDGDADRQYDSGSETLFDKFDYSYYLDGSRASETRTNADGTTTIEWTYDGLNRLISEEFDGFDGQGDPLGYVDTYSFDLSSNRTKLVHDDQTSGGGGSAGPDSTTTYVYDANDRLLAETKDVAGSTTEDRHTVYGYSPTDQTNKTVYEGLDDQGAVAQDIDFIYDATGRMTGVTMTVGSTTTTVTYRYDHNGFRVEARVDDGTNPPVTTIFHVDPNNPTGYIQVVEEGVDADGDGRLDAAEIEKAFVLGMDVLTQAAGSLLAHLLYDAHGTTRAILDAATSSVVERYVYSAYGIDLGLASAPLSSLRYAGEYIDPITGLSFNRARWYDPRSGRWNRLDPWPGILTEPLSLNAYLYAHANSVFARDPSGLNIWFALVIVALIVLVIAALLGPPSRRGAAPTGAGVRPPNLSLAASVVLNIYVDKLDKHRRFNAPGVQRELQHYTNATVFNTLPAGTVTVNIIEREGKPADLGWDDKGATRGHYVYWKRASDVFSAAGSTVPGDTETRMNLQKLDEFFETTDPNFPKDKAFAYILAHEIYWHGIANQEDGDVRGEFSHHQFFLRDRSYENISPETRSLLYRGFGFE